jgi:hypothetical protein
MNLVLMISTPPANLVAALFATALLGARHGLDCDHIAALGDLVRIESRIGHSIRLGLSYIAGHSLVIAVLGSAAVCLQLALPPVVDQWMGRVVGATLVVFSAWMGLSLLRTRHHGHYHARSRAVLLLDGGRWLFARSRRWMGRSEAAATPNLGKSKGRSSFAIGVLHGFGAETPTQLLLFLMAAKLGGVVFGLIGLGLFIVGMAVVNTLLCVVLARMFQTGAESQRFQRGLTVVTAGYSFVVGTMLLGVR